MAAVAREAVAKVARVPRVPRTPRNEAPKFVPLPKPLVGLDASDENGEPFCFDAALGTCTKAKWGETCPKGWHKCMAPGCKKLHAYVGNH